MTYFARPLAAVVTPWFYNHGWSANGVTALRGVLSMAALTGLIFLHPQLLIFSVVLFYVVFVLDCVDGNLARLDNQATYWGKFIDGLVDGIFISLAPSFTGMGSWLVTGDTRHLIAGFGVTLFALAAQMVRYRLSFFREWMVAQTGPLSAEQERYLSVPQRIERAGITCMVNVTFFAPILLIMPAGAQYYLLILLLTQVPCDVLRLATGLWQAKAMLRRGRRSIRAADAPRAMP